MINKENMQEIAYKFLKDIISDMYYGDFETKEIKYKGECRKVSLRSYGKNYSDIEISYDWKKKDIQIEYTITEDKNEAVGEIYVFTNDKIVECFEKIVDQIESEKKAIEREMAYKKKNYGREWI